MPVTASAPVSILLVDDQPSRLLTYEAILAPLGHRLVTAGSGIEALKRLMHGEFAVILLDVSMPDMDGFETARLVHQHPRFESTPIIFVTGVHMSELDELKGYELGAVDYVYVPVVPQILRSKVQVLVELHCQRLELRELNAALKREAEGELAMLNATLEGAVRELEASNTALTQEVEERRRAEQALIEADKRKDDFLAILAHELRNPLAPIRTAVAILQRNGTQDPTLVRMREVIERQALHMTRLIDDLLDVARITQGKINLRPEPAEVGAAARRAVELNMPAIEARRHAIVVKDGEPLRVHADPVRLTQVIGNLVNNAAKYTPEGGRIELELAADGDFAAVTVRDNGIGIEGEYLAHVFELFGQVQNPRPHGHDGLGIGLALVQRIVEMHGGRVEARSGGEGHGSEFVVRLPLLRPTGGTAAGEPEAPAPRIAGRRILIVDDSTDNRESLEMLLAGDGNEVRTSEDGSSALAVAAAFEPDIVLLDIRMPGMDGYEVARRLRDQPHGRRAMLVAVTGWGQPEHRERSRSAGFDGHLTKPLEYDALCRLVQSLSERARSREPARATSVA
jgi:signal transduction histidine kinase